MVVNSGSLTINLQNSDNKGKIDIRTLGHVDYPKSTLQAAITKHLILSGANVDLEPLFEEKQKTLMKKDIKKK